MTRHLETPEQSSGGICTWVLRLPHTGQYVVDPADRSKLSYDVRSAHVWFDEDRAKTAGQAFGGARAERARP